MNYTIIGEQIQKYRKAAKLTQKDLGETLGISSSAVSQWETGGTPDISLLPAIADKLGISINALFGREDITPENMQEALPRYVASLPETDRLKAICRLMWTAIKSGCTEFNVLSDHLSQKYHIYFSSEEGIAMGIDSDEMLSLSVFPEPEAGYHALFASDDTCRRLFLALSKPHAMELLKLLYQQTKPCTAEVLAKRLETEVGEILPLLSEFAGLRLVQELELETENGDTAVYSTAACGALIPLLHAAHLMMERSNVHAMTVDKRKTPLLRKPETHPSRGQDSAFRHEMQTACDLPEGSSTFTGKTTET